MLQKYYKYAIILIYGQKKVIVMLAATIIYILLFIVFALVSFSVMQIKLAGLNVKDFWSFIEANQTLDRLYTFAKRYEKLSAHEQIIFLSEAEKVFKSFEKVPSMLWEDEYQKYSDVLNTYKNIRLDRWSTSNG